jgi:8-oxo-dGTP diphosphatase
MSLVSVVAAIIRSPDGLLLCAQRGPGMSEADYWEFPGGKVCAGETEQQALVREIEEELNCRITVREHFHTHVHPHAAPTISLACYFATIIDGSPIPLEHQALCWLAQADLTQLDWAPADRPAVQRLVNLSRHAKTEPY